MAYARLLRNLLPDDFVIEYQYAYEDKKHNSECLSIPRSSPEQLLIDAEKLLDEHHVVENQEYMTNLRCFIWQCPLREILCMYTSLKWEEEEIDIRWWSARLDCRASIGLTEFTFHIWHGDNHASKDDESFSNGVGGQDFSDEDFAFWFFDEMEDIFRYDKEINKITP